MGRRKGKEGGGADTKMVSFVLPPAIASIGDSGKKGYDGAVTIVLADIT